MSPGVRLRVDLDLVEGELSGWALDPARRSEDLGGWLEPIALVQRAAPALAPPGGPSEEQPGAPGTEGTGRP